MSKTPPKKKPKPIYLVVQQGGSSREFYLHTFDTIKEVDDYRKSCDKAAYRTSAPIKITKAVENVLDQINDIVTAAVEMV